MSVRQHLMHHHATAALRVVAPLFAEDKQKAILAAVATLDDSMSLANLEAANNLMHRLAHEAIDPAIKAAAHATCYALASVQGRMIDLP
jgi:predicted YcjX-like family ATPase